MKVMIRTLLGAAAAATLFTAAVGAQSSAISHPVGRPGSAGHLHQQQRERDSDGAPDGVRRTPASRTKPEELATARSGSARSAPRRRPRPSAARRKRTPGAGPKHWYENYNASNSRAWMIQDAPDYKMPATTDAARQRAAARSAAAAAATATSPGRSTARRTSSLYERCITRGVPGSMMPAIYGNSYHIVQGPGLRGDPATRWCTTRASSRSTAASELTPPTWSPTWATARGHWEGDTLVVETDQLPEASALRRRVEQAEDRSSASRPTSENTIEWSITFDDAHTWVKPWTFGMNLDARRRAPARSSTRATRGNEGLRGILSAARAAEKEQAAHPSK